MTWPNCGVPQQYYGFSPPNYGMPSQYGFASQQGVSIPQAMYPPTDCQSQGYVPNYSEPNFAGHAQHSDGEKVSKYGMSPQNYGLSTSQQWITTPQSMYPTECQFPGYDSSDSGPDFVSPSQQSEEKSIAEQIKIFDRKIAQILAFADEEEKCNDNEEAEKSRFTAKDLAEYRNLLLRFLPNNDDHQFAPKECELSTKESPEISAKIAEVEANSVADYPPKGASYEEFLEWMESGNPEPETSAPIYRIGIAIDHGRTENEGEKEERMAPKLGGIDKSENSKGPLRKEEKWQKSGSESMEEQPQLVSKIRSDLDGHRMHIDGRQPIFGETDGMENEKGMSNEMNGRVWNEFIVANTGEEAMKISDFGAEKMDKIGQMCVANSNFGQCFSPQKQLNGTKIRHRSCAEESG